MQEVKIAPPIYFQGRNRLFGFWRGWGKKEKMTSDLPWFDQWGLRPLSLLLLIIGNPLTIEWGGPYIGYTGNMERGIQTIGPNRNALGLKIQ